MPQRIHACPGRQARIRGGSTANRANVQSPSCRSQPSICFTLGRHRRSHWRACHALPFDLHRPFNVSCPSLVRGLHILGLTAKIDNGYCSYDTGSRYSLLHVPAQFLSLGGATTARDPREEPSGPQSARKAGTTALVGWILLNDLSLLVRRSTRPSAYPTGG